MITLKKSSLKYKDPQDGSMKDVGAIIGGNAGKDGEDGFSPIAKVEETENGAIITIIDKNGKTTVDVKNGQDGDNGVDGIGITKSEIDEDGNLVITYSDETIATLGKVVGENGQDGLDGKSAYQYAQEGGFEGTEEEFAQKLAKEFPTVPTKTSDLDNDSGFITKEDIPNIEIPDVDLSEYATKEYVENYSVVLSHDGNGNATIEGLVVLVDGNEVEY